MKISLLVSRLHLNNLIYAAVAVAVGLIYFKAGAAPLRYSIVNLATLIAGTILVLFIDPKAWSLRFTNVLIVFVGTLLLMVGTWGISMQGASRWLSFGNLIIEPSMMLLPLAVILFARNQNVFSTFGIILSACGVALQPDRSMAATLCISILALLLVKRNKWIAMASSAAVIALGITLNRPDYVSPAPFVEKVFDSAFSFNPFFGIIVTIAAALLLLPAAGGIINSKGEQKTIHLAFAGVWLTLFVAAVIGNYPTPLLGYGCSAILGYLLSLRCLSSFSFSQ